VRILGIDPGSRVAGWALVEVDRGRVTALELGAWKVPGGRDRARSLGELASRAEAFLAGRDPEVAAVESLFHHRNARSVLVLAEARGVLLSVLGRLGIPVREYAPAEIKQTICGNGNATKDQVRRVLPRTFPGLARFPLDGVPDDATDALAAALTHAVRARFESRVPGRDG